MSTKDQNIKNTEKSNPPQDKSEISKDELSSLIDSMISDQKKLQNGYELLSNYEFRKNFYFNILKICFEAEKEQKITKMKSLILLLI